MEMNILNEVHLGHKKITERIFVTRRYVRILIKVKFAFKRNDSMMVRTVNSNLIFRSLIVERTTVWNEHIQVLNDHFITSAN